MKWLIFFLMFPHLKPAGLVYLWPTIDMVFDAGRLLSALLVLYLHFLKKKLPSTPVWVLAAFQIWLLFVTFLRARENFGGTLITAASILTVTLLIDFFSGNVNALLSGVMFNMEILIYANFASILLYYPVGLFQIQPWNPCYFLGGHNSFVVYVLPTIVIALLYVSTTGKKLRPLLVIVAGVLSISITWSATSVCGLLIFVAILLLCKTPAREIITYRNIFAGAIVIDLLVSVFRVMDRVLLLANFIESFLRKEVTLTGRTALWDNFYQRFLDSPWLGYGAVAESVVGTGLSAHNQWFQFLLEGGILGLLLFLIFNFSVAKKLERSDGSRPVTIFYAFFASAYIIFIADVYLGVPWLYIPFILSYHVNKFGATSVQAVHQIHLAKRGNYVPNRKLPEEH